MTISEVTCYEFDAFRFYVNGGYLTHEGHPISIQPQMAQVLSVLLRNAGSVVSKDSLLAEAWTVSVEGQGAGQQIYLLRKLFLTYGKRRYIETEKKRGFRFDGSVRPCPGSHDGNLVSYFSRHGFFEDYTERFSELFAQAESLTVYFIHSRRWRENHRHEINAFLARPDSRLTVFLPNLENEVLMEGLKEGFLDGQSIPHLTKEAYQDFAEYYFAFPGRVSIRKFDHYPNYSFYLFDDVLITAMYPTVVAKHQVPTLELAPESPYWTFFEDDRKDLLMTKELSKSKLTRIRNNK